TKLQELDQLHAVPLFQGVGGPLLARIQAITQPVTAAEGEELCRQGLYPQYLHILLEGQVALTSTAADGSTAVVEVIRPGGHFVLASVLAEVPYPMSARAITSSRLLAIDAVALLELVESEPDLAAALLRSV